MQTKLKGFKTLFCTVLNCKISNHSFVTQYKNLPSLALHNSIPISPYFSLELVMHWSRSELEHLTKSIYLNDLAPLKLSWKEANARKRMKMEQFRVWYGFSILVFIPKTWWHKLTVSCIDCGVSSCLKDFEPCRNVFQIPSMPCRLMAVNLRRKW